MQNVASAQNQDILTAVLTLSTGKLALSFLRATPRWAESPSSAAATGSIMRLMRAENGEEAAQASIESFEG